MTDLVLASMAALLGAATLAIVLLYKGWKSNRAEITKLQAQIAAQQIAALTGGGPVTGLTAEPEPVRRKRHLALYIGAGAIAAFASIGDRIRNLWRSHRTLTVTAVTTVATVGTAAAIYMAPTRDSSEDTRSSGPAPTAPDQETSGDASATTGQEPDQYTEETAGGPLVMPKSLTVPQGQYFSGSASPSPSTSGAPAAGERSTSGEEDAEEVLTRPSEQPMTPVPGQPPTKKPEPGEERPGAGAGTDPGPDPEPDPEPEPIPTPQPDPPATEEPDNDGKDGLVCLDLPPLLDLCLLGTR
ncbi:hypothetical protein [Streptomyces sp. NPDC006355]|uniref:hypothetical protein n=1 Tax=Streptomyces sp. NPDC006355 TaxID=3156758 RepID=UPI0033B4CDA8